MDPLSEQRFWVEVKFLKHHQVLSFIKRFIKGKFVPSNETTFNNPEAKHHHVVFLSDSHIIKFSLFSFANEWALCMLTGFKLFYLISASCTKCVLWGGLCAFKEVIWKKRRWFVIQSIDVPAVEGKSGARIQRSIQSWFSDAWKKNRIISKASLWS